MSELKKCPFCGGEFYIDVGGMIYIPRCKKCSCSLAGCRTRERAIELANTRPAMDNILENIVSSLESEKTVFLGTRTEQTDTILIDDAINIVMQEINNGLE